MRNYFQVQEQILYNCPKPSLSLVLSALLKATEHSSNTCTGLSDESLLSVLFTLVFLSFYH